MKRIVNITLISITTLLVLFALGESIGRIGDLKLAKDQPELLAADSFHIHYANHAVIMYIHVIAGMAFLISGTYQLIPSFRIKNIKGHRLVGKIFLAISFVVSISAMVFSIYYPFGDHIETAANLIFGVYILIATIKAYTTIKQKRVIEHANWVRRVFFVSLSIATIWLIMIATNIITGASVQQVMGQSFLIGFSLHTIIVELWIYQNVNLTRNAAG